MDFKDLIPHPGILKTLEEAGYTNPTPIQEQAIPLILSGRDLRASAQTGTGKTAAFILPSLVRLTTPSPIQVKGPRILILVPTRELAMQVANEAVKYSRYLSQVKTVCIYGGAPYPIQNRELSRHHEILVATPGRLMDHMERGRINFSRLELLILDEADRMLDMGFIDAVEEIVAAIPKTRQTLMFSATLKGSVLNLSRRLLNDPAEVNVAHEHAKHENIEQRLHAVENLDHKYRLLDDLLNDPMLHQAIVFTSTKRQADSLVDKLSRSGQQAAVLHGGMKQGQRTRTILQLRQGKTRVLVATDVAARGIDIPAISHVINFDLPMSVEDYVHRIGRTGRAGAKGIALSFATPRDMQTVRRIERFTGQKIISQSMSNADSVDGYVPSRPKPRSRPFIKRAAPREYRPAGQKSFNPKHRKPRD
ncbi:MAG: DEAD/DEAH box helicase [Simkania sp.]|nr:DEAD/DEAH box helicase [Simkania sp.]